MKIGINARFLLKGKLEGIGWYCNEIIRRMVFQYPQHTFILFFDRTHSKDFIYAPNVEAVEVGPPARHPFLWYIWFEWTLPRALKKHKVDLFISMDGYCSLSTNIPQFMVMHDLAYLHFPNQISSLVELYYRYFVPKFLKKVNHIFAVSESTKKDILDHFDIPNTKVDVCYNGVRNSFRKLSVEEIQQVRNNYSSGYPYFLFVGAIHPRKNVAGLIRAFNIFKQKTGSTMRLIIIGRKAWLTSEVEEALKQSSFKDQIIMIDHIDTLELAQITGAAHAAVAPSFLEGFGVPVLEALYSEIPVLCSDRFSLPEVAGPGALLFDPDSDQSIADAMQKSITDSSREERIRLGNIQKLKFNWDKSVEVISRLMFG